MKTEERVFQQHWTQEDKQEPMVDSRSLMAVVGRSRLGNGGRYCKHTQSRDDGPH